MSAQSYTKYMLYKSGEIQSVCQSLETQLSSHIELQENTAKAMGTVTPAYTGSFMAVYCSLF